MTDEQIAALAREYAEWVTEAEGGNNDYTPAEQAIASAFLRWLSQRYCLVEKSKIKETWKEITNVYIAHRHITYDGARYLFNEVLFPEIAKEMEG